MFSFKSIALFSALLSSSFTFGAPTTTDFSLSKREPVMVSSEDVPVVGNYFDLSLDVFAPIETRADLVPLPAIVSKLIVDLTPLCDKLKSFTKDDMTVNKVSPITAEMSGLVVAATANVKKLVGKPVDIVLATADGVLTLVEATELIRNLLETVFLALSFVLSLVSTLKISIILPLLANVGEVVGDLMVAIIAVVSDLQEFIVPILADLIKIIRALNINTILKMLGLNV